MGGKALKKVKTVRKERKEYLIIKNFITQKLTELHITHAVVRELPYKKDFGDLDVLICLDSSIEKEQLINSFGPTEVFQNDNVYSFDYCDFQIDFIFIENLNYLELANFFYSYSDLGSILGHIMNSIGLKFGAMGLFVPHFRIILSIDSEEICKFMGYDYAKWLKGFETELEIFEWIITGSYFNANFFQILNKEHRKRLVKILLNRILINNLIICIIYVINIFPYKSICCFLSTFTCSRYTSTIRFS